VKIALDFVSQYLPWNTIFCVSFKPFQYLNPVILHTAVLKSYNQNEDVRFCDRLSLSNICRVSTVYSSKYVQRFNIVSSCYAKYMFVCFVYIYEVFVCLFLEVWKIAFYDNSNSCYLTQKNLLYFYLTVPALFVNRSLLFYHYIR